MDILSCLSNIIGLSETECPCFDTDKPVDFDESNSGIYLDQLEGFNLDLASGADDCGKGGIWERMEQARRNAIIDYKNNLMGCVGQNYKPRIKTFDAQLGNSTYQGSLNYTQSFVGLKITPIQVKDGYIVLKRIGVLVNASVPVTVRVYNNVPSNGDESTLLFQSPPINAIADTITWAALTTPLELPMWNYDKQVRYFIVYVMDGAYQPKDNKKDCGCNGASRPYLQWLDYFGIVGNDLDFTNFSQTNSANGMSLEIQVKCKATNVICSDEYPMNYEDDSDALNAAYAIRFRAGARLYEDLLNSGKINRFTLFNREYVQAKITEWNTEYMNWINYLCANIDVGLNDCLICKTNNQNSLIKTNINVTGHNFSWLNDSDGRYD